MAAELAGLTGGGERLAALAPEIDAAGAEAAALAGVIARARQKAAKAFCAGVEAELSGLAMARCRLEVAFSPPEGGVAAGGALLGPDGAEQALYLLAPNPGEPPRPLARIASGGELSRVLLAVKRTLARRDPVLTYVFDEVDSGIGGAVAEAMGRVLAEVAGGRQVICITHLPQIAAFADRHHRVEKRVAGGRTTSEVALLERADEQRQEVARMMAGATVTAAALEHAGALIAAAQAPAPGRSEGGGRRRAARPPDRPRCHPERSGSPRPGADHALTLARSQGYAAERGRHRPSGSPRAASPTSASGASTTRTRCSSTSRSALFVVADGMGGHAGGGTASRIAVETIRRMILPAREEEPALFGSGADGRGEPAPRRPRPRRRAGLRRHLRGRPGRPRAGGDGDHGHGGARRRPLRLRRPRRGQPRPTCSAPATSTRSPRTTRW